MADGLKGTVPMGVLKEEFHQMSLFEPIQDVDEVENEPEVPCKIYDWRRQISILYCDMGKVR